MTSRELISAGINMNMAPVLDVALPGQEGIMRDRAFGDDPAWVTTLGMAVIKHLQDKGIMAIAKHFPGIGKTRLDSHLDLPFLDEPLSLLEKEDLPPFKAAIEHGVAGIMLSHICYRLLDEKWPASLSENIAGELLRKRMGFQGVVMTDDLDMGAITRHFTVNQTIHRILAADIDIALWDLAAQRAGLYYTAISSRLGAEEISYIVDDCGARVLVSSRAVHEAASAVPELAPGCTGCAACALVCPDFCFTVYRYDTPVEHGAVS